MVEQCQNCDYVRVRTFSTGRAPVFECHVVEPPWMVVESVDWCGKYQPPGWNDPSNLITQGVTLTSVTKTKVISTPGYVLWLTQSSLVNSSGNSVVATFYDGNTSSVITVSSIPANEQTGGTINPPVRANSGEVWVSLNRAPAEVYIYLQGKRGGPR